VLPRLTLSASPSDLAVVPLPASVAISASIFSGTYPTQRVEFYRNNVKIAEDTSAPYSAQVVFDGEDAPAGSVTARVFDSQGNASETASVTVQVRAQALPEIRSFTATPSTLGFAGGKVRLAWDTGGANLARIDNGVGFVIATGTGLFRPRSTSM
jgi:hypothetical protein